MGDFYTGTSFRRPLTEFTDDELRAAMIEHEKYAHDSSCYKCARSEHQLAEEGRKRGIDYLTVVGID